MRVNIAPFVVFTNIFATAAAMAGEQRMLRLAQAQTQTFASCMMGCNGQAAQCLGVCTPTLSGTTAGTSVTIVGVTTNPSQCVLNCTSQQQICSLGCRGLQ